MHQIEPQHTVRMGIDYQDDDAFYHQYYGTGLNKCDHHFLYPEKTELEIYITTFDGLLYVEYQVKTLRRFLGDFHFNIVIVDTNSHINPEASEKTKAFCIEKGVSYVKLPHNKFQDLNQFSFKLGTDMNWIWRNLVRVRKPIYFGFLDQDCFLIKPIWNKLKQRLDKQGMYGLTWNTPDKKYWLIHIMQNFFKYDFVENVELDFRPAGHAGLDTGGCNYFSLFKNYKQEDYFQDEKNLSEFVGYQWKNVFRDFTLNDEQNWLHVRNSTHKFSGHPSEREFKEVYMTGILDGILLKDK